MAENIERQSDVPQLSREQLATLIPICPLIMDWLRNVTNHAADLFQQSFEEDYDHVAMALYQVVSTLEASPNPPFAVLSTIFSKFRVTVWANALRLILTQSQPRIISPEVGGDLVGTIPRLNAACTVTEVCHILGPFLDKLPRSYFVTLGEFCALLRDTGTNATFLACLVGPQLLLPNLLINSPKNQGPGALAAAAIMELLIAESESLFGRSANRRMFLPFGEFGDVAKAARNKLDGRIDFVKAGHDPTFVVAKAALRAFYDWRDPVKSTNTERLFKRLLILDIAKGLQDKYGLIPPGWGIIIRIVLERDNQNKGFESPLPTRRPSKDNATATMLPGEMTADIAKMKAAARRRPKKETGYQEGERLKRIVEEVCKSENTYHELLNTFVNTYCEKLHNIINGREGDAALQALGLTAQDVETVFGRKLNKVNDVAGLFVGQLGVLTDFDGQTDNDGRGKLGLLLDAFKEIFSKLEVLGPYMATYAQVLKLINSRRDEIRKASSKKKKKRKKGLNFIQIWELERVKHENLRLSSLENILIRPVQRIPHYKTLVKELIGQCKKDKHPALKEVEALLADVERLGQKIDRQVSNNNSKSNKLLGLE